MAFLAGRQLTMPGMTFGAGQGGMLCLAGLQQLERFAMAAGAKLLGLGYGVRYCQWGVYRMAG